MYRICMAYDHFVFPPLSNWWLDEHLKGSEIHIFDLEYPDSLLWNEKKDASKSTVYLEIELFSSAHTKEDLPSLSCQLLPRGCCLTVPRAHRCDNLHKSCIIHMCSSGGTDGLFPASHTRHNWDLIVGYRLARLFYLLLQYCNWLDIMQKSWEPQLSISTKLHTIYINRWVVTFGDQWQQRSLHVPLEARRAQKLRQKMQRAPLSCHSDIEGISLPGAAAGSQFCGMPEKQLLVALNFQMWNF